MKTGRCPKCHSAEIIPEVMIEDRGMSNVPWSLGVRVDERPRALLFKGRHTEELMAWICGTCGFTELYVANGAELYEAYARALGDRLPEQTHNVEPEEA